MRREIIKRFAAGTFSICFAYAMIRQPFDTITGTSGKAADWNLAAITETTETAASSSETEAEVDPFSAEETTEGDELYETEEMTEDEESYSTEGIIEDDTRENVYDDTYEDTYEEETTAAQQDEENVEKPTLSQFLSGMICGGCHRRCLLISPGCMRGQMKAENAMEEYYDTYGE